MKTQFARSTKVKGFDGSSQAVEVTPPAGNALYEAYRPLAILGRLLGFSPVLNLANVASGSDKSFWARCFRLIYTLLVLGVLAYRITMLQFSNGNRVMKFLAETTNASTKIVILHFLFRTPAYMTFFRKWGEVIREDFLTPAAQFHLIGFGRVVTGLSIFITVGHCLWDNWSLWISFFQFYGWTLQSTYLCYMALELFTLVYVQMSAAILCRGLSLAFVQLNGQIKEALSTDVRTVAPLTAHRLRALRKVHQHLCGLSQAANELYFPGVYAGFLASAIWMTHNIVHFVLMQQRTTTRFSLRIYAYVGSAAIRFIPIILHCYLAAEVCSQSNMGLEHIYRSPLVRMPSKVRFQIRLLETQLLKYSGKLSAFGIMGIDRGMLVQIIGFVATFIMLQMDNR